MRAELKRLHSPDVHSLKTYVPKEKNKFAFLLQAMIGPEGEEGEESFDILVCTPEWLEEKIGINEMLVARHHLIIREYDYHRLVNRIKDFLRDCTGDNWHQIANKVSRLGKWEFEDYNS